MDWQGATPIHQEQQWAQAQLLEPRPPQLQQQQPGDQQGWLAAARGAPSGGAWQTRSLAAQWRAALRPPDLDDGEPPALAHEQHAKQLSRHGEGAPGSHGEGAHHRQGQRLVPALQQAPGHPAQTVPRGAALEATGVSSHQLQYSRPHAAAEGQQAQWQQRQQQQQQQAQAQAQQQQEQAQQQWQTQHQWQQQRGPPAHPPHARHGAPARQPQRLRLADWGLPPRVVEAFASKGVREIYPWQAAALECGEDSSNLVYCAPTSGGKSLVADVLMIKRLITTSRFLGPRHKPAYGRALVVLPYISIVAEKTEHLACVLAPLGCAGVKGYFGNEEGGAALGPRGETVAVCTIEKANVAINRLAQEGRLGELCCIVIDELHMVADPERGPVLEMMLAKVLHAARGTAPALRPQIIGMSATMGGLEALRGWLGASLFMTDYRPVPLTEHVLFEGKVFHKEARRPTQQQELEAGASTSPLVEGRELPLSADPRRDPDRLAPLVAEAACEGHSVLVFCSSRVASVKVAAMLAELLPPLGAPERQGELGARRADAVAGIEDAMGGAMDPALKACMLAGVAFHSAALTMEERRGVEAAYRAGALLVLTSTSTLAAGVNLPARRVILRSLRQGPVNVPRAQYLQMVGRAGRAGQSAVGESFILGKGMKEWSDILSLITAPIPVVQSQLLPASLESWGPDSAPAHCGRLQQLLLEAASCGLGRTPDDIRSLLACTLAARQRPGLVTPAAEAAHRILSCALRTLSMLCWKELGLILWVPAVPGEPLHRGCWAPTHKGQAVFDSALPLEKAMRLYDDLKAAEDGVVLGHPLHMVYLCLLDHPFTVQSWRQWLCTLSNLSEPSRRVAAAAGVDVGFAQRRCQSFSLRAADVATAARHSRFVAALAVSALMGESSLEEVARQWGAGKVYTRDGISAGQLQKLQADAAKWMAMAGLLCESAGWWPLATLYSSMAQTMAAGVRHELLDLMRVPAMNPAKARLLHRAGVKDPHALATADEGAVARALAPGAAQQMRSRRPPPKPGSRGAGQVEAQQQQAGADAGRAKGAYAAAGMAARAAKTLVRSARDLILGEAAQARNELSYADMEAMAARGLPALEGDMDPALLPADAPAAGILSAAQFTAAGDELSAEEVQALREAIGAASQSRPAGRPATLAALAVMDDPLSIAPAARLEWARGLTRIVEVRATTPDDAVQFFLDAWMSQVRYALAVHLADLTAPAAGGQPQQAQRNPGGGGACKPAQVRGLAVAWASGEAVYFIDLSAANLSRRVAAAAGVREEGTLLQALAGMLGRPGPSTLCHDAAAVLPQLAAVGLRVACPVEDPCVAAWLLAPYTLPEEGSLRALQGRLAPNCKPRVPNLLRAGVTASCRAALLTLAVTEPALDLLRNQGMLTAFLHLEMPAAVAVAGVNAAAPRTALALPALAARQHAAGAAAAAAERRVQDRYGMPTLRLSDDEIILMLLSALKLPHPQQHGRGRPTVSLYHLQALLQRCSPHSEGAAFDVIAACVAYRSLHQGLLRPAADLLYGRRGEECGDGPGPAPAAGGPPALLLRQAAGPVGGLGYGPAAGPPLAALLAPDWGPLLAEVSSATLQEELDRQGLVVGPLDPGAGLPVALWLPPGLAPPGGPATGEALMPVLGSVIRLVGKKLRTALDFSQPPGEAARGSAAAGGSGSLRVELAVVRLTAPPAGGPGAAGAPLPHSTEVQLPCDQLWRLAGAAACLGGGGGGGADPPAATCQRWVAGRWAGCPELVAAAPGEALLALECCHMEVTVLAELSGDPALLESLGGGAGQGGGGGDPYLPICRRWAAAAARAARDGRVDGVPLAPWAAAAVLRSLVGGWSAGRLAGALRGDRGQAAAVQALLLEALPGVRRWCLETAERAERAGVAVTAGGRRAPFACPLSKTDPKAKGRLHRAVLAYVLAGSQADLVNAALAAAHSALSRRAAWAAAAPPTLALVMGPCLVVRCGAGDVPAAAGLLLGALQELRLGRQRLRAPLQVRASAGPTLDALHLAEVQPLGRIAT